MLGLMQLWGGSPQTVLGAPQCQPANRCKGTLGQSWRPSAWHKQYPEQTWQQFIGQTAGGFRSVFVALSRFVKLKKEEEEEEMREEIKTA